MHDSIPAFDSAETPPLELRPDRFRAALRSASGLLGGALLVLALLAGLLAPVLAPHDPFAIVGPSLEAPSSRFPMGTDSLGRDLWSGVLFGARTSLFVSVFVGGIALVLGSLVGGVSGFLGGRLDDALMRFTEFFQILPRFFFAVVVVAVFGPGLDRLILVLGLTSWPTLARVIRAEVLALRHLDFVRAAEAYGASRFRILTRELLPNALPSTLVMLGLLVGQVLLIEASLGFIGLGDPNIVSWGALAGQAQGFIQIAWWLPLFPGLAITGTVLGFNLLGDAVSARLGGR